MYSKQAIEITKKTAYCPEFMQFFSQNNYQYLLSFYDPCNTFKRQMRQDI